MPKYRVEFTRSHLVTEETHVVVEAADHKAAEERAYEDMKKNPSGFEWDEIGSDPRECPTIFGTKEVQ